MSEKVCSVCASGKCLRVTHATEDESRPPLSAEPMGNALRRRARTHFVKQS